MPSYHIEYIIHVYVNANDEDTAKTLGSEFLEKADRYNELHGECEFLAIEKEEEEEEEEEES
jgi:hypothetical protein